MESVQPIRSAEKIRQMEDYLRRQSDRNWLLFFTGINTGLRISDLRLLRVAHVRGKEHLVVRTKKTGKVVQVWITRPLAGALASYTAALEEGDYLFRSRKGWNQPLTRGQCYQIIKRAAQACGIERVGTHSMRKTFGWHFYQKTRDIVKLQELFGHKSPDITLRYIGVVQDDLDQAMKRFAIGG